MPTREEHFITFKADGIGEVRVLKGETAPKVTGGYGGWELAPRPHRTALTIWPGNEPIRMAIPVVFEGWTDEDGQEVRISKLSRMALPQGDGEPPIVQISGLGVPKPGPVRWVIEGFDWGDNVLWDQDRDSGSTVRLRQDVTVNLLQYVAEDRVAFSKLAAAKPGGGAWPKHYTWRKGDTLRKVASKFYHDSTKWRRIASANHVRDPQNIKVGRVLIIPKP